MAGMLIEPSHLKTTMPSCVATGSASYLYMTLRHQGRVVLHVVMLVSYAFSHEGIVVRSIHHDLFDVIDPRHQLVRYALGLAYHSCLLKGKIAAVGQHRSAITLVNSL